MIDKQLNSKRDCMGCHACANICPGSCIQMKNDDEGFWYPKVNYDLCITCNRCIDVCPIINKPNINGTPAAFACINNDEQIRSKSSSGGIFSLVAEKVIALGGVVFGAALNANFETEHIYVENIDDLRLLRGSKYVQSKIGNTYKKAKEFLHMGRKILFSGTPCQIAGLKAYLEKDYDNLITLDIICHGVPSPKVWKKYINEREQSAGAKALNIFFRQKAEGWKCFSMFFSFDNNSSYRQNVRRDPYLTVFLKNVCLRPSCHDCEFKSLNRYGDLTLADFWGVHDVLPEMDDDKGTSLVFVNSKAGQEIFDEIKAAMSWAAVEAVEAVQFNPAAIQSAKMNPNREAYMSELDVTSFDELVEKYCKDKLLVRVKKKVRTSGARILRKLGLTNLVKSLIR